LWAGEIGRRRGQIARCGRIFSALFCVEREEVMRFSIRARGALLACAVLLALAPRVARADDDSMESEGGLGAAAALCTLLYGPVKVLYATGGLLVGGLAWGLSGGDGDVLRAVVTPAVRGDYVVTPSLLRGERPIEFFGKDPEYRTTTAEASPEDVQQVY
jgi:hypothetical protein